MDFALEKKINQNNKLLLFAWGNGPCFSAPVLLIAQAL